MALTKKDEALIARMVKLSAAIEAHAEGNDLKDSWLEAMDRIDQAAAIIESAAIDDSEDWELVMTTNNAYDSILLCDSSWNVISAWTATPELVKKFLTVPAPQWKAGHWPKGFDGGPNYIDAYGTECGKNGTITDESRREFWHVNPD